MAPVGVDDDQLKVMRREANMPEFRSETAREDYERARRLRVVMKIIGVIVALLVWSGFMYWIGGGRGGKPGGPSAVAHSGHDHDDHKKIEIDPVGSPQAKVRIECVLPEGTDCHDPIIKFLQETAAKRPAEIRVEFKGMSDYDEADLTNKAGSFCAAVLVNDRPDHEIVSEGKRRVVNLVGTIPTHYSLWDLGETIRHIHEQAYGKAEDAIFELPEGEERKPANVPETPVEEVPKKEFKLTLPGFKELTKDNE
ncbi:MAG: hypothetical protein HN742_42720 [Lentisphaerae bacterium]|nr:hypothetical protein [Lentisphaerota bacterium]MBT4818492.1 hypothetical protein [Lentisphaerota bacterium]MBT5609485.1 hypothetical protein [Lentisphaerota bacterium]MBT7057704.1 hypothetical protein [Lentisphaerota bacterium]MBT7848653.1 hypothetical protein [Lentisphaerota bacterium]